MFQGKKQFKLLLSIVLSILISAMYVGPVFAATPQNTLNASATLAYNLQRTQSQLRCSKSLHRINLCLCNSAVWGYLLSFKITYKRK